MTKRCIRTGVLEMYYKEVIRILNRVSFYNVSPNVTNIICYSAIRQGI